MATSNEHIVCNLMSFFVSMVNEQVMSMKFESKFQNSNYCKIRNCNDFYISCSMTIIISIDNEQLMSDGTNSAVNYETLIMLIIWNICTIAIGN